MLIRPNLPLRSPHAARPPAATSQTWDVKDEFAHQGKKIGTLLAASVLGPAIPLTVAIAGALASAPVVAAVALSPVGLVGGLVVASLEERHLGLGRRIGGLVGRAVGHFAPEPKPPNTDPVELRKQAPTGARPREALGPALLHRISARPRTRNVELGENLGATLATMAAGLIVPGVIAATIPGGGLVAGTMLGPLFGLIVGGIEENTLGLGRTLGELVGRALPSNERPPRPATEQPHHQPAATDTPRGTSPLARAFARAGQVIAEPLIASLIDATRLTNRLFAEEPVQTVEFQKRTQPAIDPERVLHNFVKLAGVNGTSGNESAVADEVHKQLEDLGARVERRPDHTLIATLDGTVPDAPTVVLSAHQDTVAPTSAAAIRWDDQRVHTDGTHILGADDRAGIAEILEAVRAVRESGTPHPELKLVFTVSEETGLHGASRLVPEDITTRPALGVVVDSTDVRDLNLTNDSVIINPRTVKYQFSQEEPVVQLAQYSMAQAGIEPRPIHAPIMTGAGTDANTPAFNSKNITTIAIGSGQRDIHSPLENIRRSDLERVSQALVGVIANAADFRVEGSSVQARREVAQALESPRSGRGPVFTSL